jgi:signal transduction histidine kinase
MSTSFFALACFNWFSFGAWAHFTYCFPGERDIVRNRPWLPPLFYLVPPLTTIAVSLSLSGFNPEFWGWLQRLRNIFLPVIIIGTFTKHLIDFIKIPANDPVRNQIKLPLSAFWLSFGPYLFLYLLPNLILDHPLIYFRTVVLAFMILPISYLVALLRYRLFEVDKMISKILAYIGLIIGVSILYSLLIVLLKRWLWGDKALPEELFLIFLVLVITLFNPAVNWLQKTINRYFFGNIPLNTTLLHTLSRRINAALQISDLVQIITCDLAGEFGIKKIAVAVMDNDHVRFFPQNLSPDLLTAFGRHRLTDLFDDHDEYVLCRSVPGNEQRTKLLLVLRNLGWTMIFQLPGSSRLRGAMFIGEKTNNRLPVTDDIHFLATLANHIGVALENGLHYERLDRSKKEQEKIFKQLMQNERMAAIGEMTTTLAHELKNPLATIRSSAQYVAQKPRSPEVSQEILGYIIDEVDALNLTISSLLGLARHREPIFKPVDLFTDIPTIVNRWKNSEAHAPAIALHCEIPAPLPTLYCDINQLSQVILNLIRNAEEAMEKHGKIVVHVHKSDNHALIRIIDNGPGIIPEQLRHIFEHFFTTKIKGLGLGLPTCRQLIHAHNGSINIKNHPAGGIEALILLPFEPFEELINT